MASHSQPVEFRRGSRRQPEASRNAILHAALAEFARQGLAGARMDAIADAAGVNKALLYYYFRDKETLYRAILDTFFEPLVARILAVCQRPGSAGERFLAYASAHFDAIAESQYYAHIFMSELMSAGRGGSPLLDHIFERYMRPIGARVLKLVEEGVKSREFRAVDPNQFIPSVIGSIVHYFLTAPVRQKFMPKVDFASPEAIRERRAAVLDFAAAALFADREAGIKLAAKIAKQESAKATRGRERQAHKTRAPERSRVAATAGSREKKNGIAFSGSSPERRALMKLNKFFIFILGLMVIAAGYYFYSTDRTSDTVLIGIVDANQVIVNSKIAGRIEKLYVDEGSKVKAGDLIAEIDSGDLEAQKDAAAATINAYNSQASAMRATEAQTLGETNSGVMNAQARLASAKATLAQAKADLVRIQSDSQRMIELAKAGVESDQDRVRAEAQLDAQNAVVDSAQKNVLAAQADLDTANAKLHQQRAAASNVAMDEAQVANARAQYAEADTRLGYTKIYAPVSGTVSVRAARQGEVVSIGEPIVTIIDFNDTWVRAEAPETESRFIADGDKLKVRLPAGQPIEGTVIFKAVEGDYATQRDVSRRKRDIKTIGLKLKVDNPDGALVPGMTAEVLLPKDLTTRSLAEGAR